MTSARNSSQFSEFFSGWLEDIRRAAEIERCPNLSPLFPAKAYARVCGVDDGTHLMKTLEVEEFRRQGIPKVLYDAWEVYSAIHNGVERGSKKTKNKTSFGGGKRSPPA